MCVCACMCVCAHTRTRGPGICIEPLFLQISQLTRATCFVCGSESVSAGVSAALTHLHPHNTQHIHINIKHTHMRSYQEQWNCWRNCVTSARQKDTQHTTHKQNTSVSHVFALTCCVRVYISRAQHAMLVELLA